MTPKTILLLAGRKGSGKDTACEFAIERLRELGHSSSQFAFADSLKLATLALIKLMYGVNMDLATLNQLKNDERLIFSSRGETIGFVYLSTFICAALPLFGSWKFVAYMLVFYCVCGWFLLARVNARVLLQHFGTDIIRTYFDNNAFVNVVAAKIRASKNDVVVITDCRFDNEVIQIQAAFPDIRVIVWEVIRPLPVVADKLDSAGWSALLRTPATAKHASEQPINRALVTDTIDNCGDLEFLRSVAREFVEGQQWSPEDVD